MFALCLAGNTGSYYMVNKESGESVIGVHSSTIADRINSDYMIENVEIVNRASVLCLDANIPISTIATAVNLAVDQGVPVWMEATSIHKVRRIIESGVMGKLYGITPNFKELIMLANDLQERRAIALKLEKADKVRLRDPDTFDLDSLLQQCLELCPPLIEQVPVVIVKLGVHGLLFVQRTAPNSPQSDAVNDLKSLKFPNRYHPPLDSLQGQPIGMRAVHYCAYPTEESWASEEVSGLPANADTSRTKPRVVNMLGAGDCFVGGLVNGIVREWPIDLAIKCGLRAANFSIQSMLCVPKFINETEMHAAQVSKWARKLKVTQVF